MIRLFSRQPYLKRKAEREMVEENRRSFEREQRHRRRWRIKNSFNEKARLAKWDRKKKRAVKKIEDIVLSSIGLTDGTLSALTNMSTGLGLREIDFDNEAFEDLMTNIYLVKLADTICSDTGANLKEDDRNLVMRAVVGQLFPQPAPVSQAQIQRNSKAEALIEGIQAVRAQSRRF